MLDYSEYSYTVYTVEYGIEKSRTIYTNVANFKRYYIIILLRGIPKNTPQKAKIPKNTPYTYLHVQDKTHPERPKIQKSYICKYL